MLLDAAMSMFSYGKLEAYARSGRPLPVDGGLDSQGQPTRDASEVLKTGQPLPIGFWQGFRQCLFDVGPDGCGALRRTDQCGEVGEFEQETELSQVFLLMKLDAFGDQEILLDKIDATLQELESCPALCQGLQVRWPGQGMQRVRQESMEQGILVEEAIWEQVQNL